jgi:hypothetical protein
LRFFLAINRTERSCRAVPLIRCTETNATITLLFSAASLACLRRAVFMHPVRFARTRSAVRPLKTLRRDCSGNGCGFSFFWNRSAAPVRRDCAFGLPPSRGCRPARAAGFAFSAPFHFPLSLAWIFVQRYALLPIVRRCSGPASQPKTRCRSIGSHAG